jgi:hypothetical protein
MHRGIARLIVFGALGLGAGCAANGGDESILVLRNIFPPSTGGCTFTSTSMEIGLPQGSLSVPDSVGSGVGYQVVPQLKSRITAATGQEDQRTVLFRGANVDITFPGSSLFSAAELAAMKASTQTHFMIPFSGFLPPNGSLADAPFELMPAELMATVMAKPGFAGVLALASFQVVGELGGGDVTSQTFQYPVSLSMDTFVINNGACSALSSKFVPRTGGNPCNIIQDGKTDCCTDTGRLVCPAVGTGG